MRPRKEIRDAILGHVASWGDRRTPMSGITAKPAAAVNWPRAPAVTMMPGDRHAHIRRRRRRLPARRALVRPDVRRADARTLGRSAAAGGAGLDFSLLPPRHHRSLSDEPAGGFGDAADTCRHLRGDRAGRKSLVDRLGLIAVGGKRFRAYDDAHRAECPSIGTRKGHGGRAVAARARGLPRSRVQLRAHGLRARSCN